MINCARNKDTVLEWSLPIDFLNIIIGNVRKLCSIVSTQLLVVPNEIGAKVLNLLLVAIVTVGCWICPLRLHWKARGTETIQSAFTLGIPKFPPVWTFFESH